MHFSFVLVDVQKNSIETPPAKRTLLLSCHEANLYPQESKEGKLTQIIMRYRENENFTLIAKVLALRG